jgi:hypothetical protein
MRTLAPSLAAALIGALALACASPQGSPDPARDAAAPAEPASRTLFAPPSEPLLLDGGDDGEGMTLEELVRRYKETAAPLLLVDRALEPRLAEQRVLLSGPVTVPPRDVHATVEAILAVQGYVLLRRIDGRDVELLLTVPGEGEPGWLHRVALPVPIERVGDVRDHAALLVATVVELPSTDVVACCKAFEADPRGQATVEVVALPDTSAMLVLGTGQRVAERVGMLRAADARNAAAAGRAR